jgi:serine/threonine protein kinase
MERLFSFHETPAPQATLDAVPETLSTEWKPARPASPGADLLPGLRIAGYEIRGILGRGGMGVVYKAWQVELKRMVALKMIRPLGEVTAADKVRFQREAQAVAQLQHPNIVRIYDVGEVNGQPYFSLEFVDGGSLHQRIAGTPQSPRASANLVETLARAMHVAHQAGIIHRDLKPANILLSAECSVLDPRSKAFATSLAAQPSAANTPKITDFGLAKQLLADDGQTGPEAVLGTPSYMAPELAAGHAAAASPLSDVYSLGAILYEMLTGRPPFKGETAWATVELVKTTEPMPPTRLNPRVPRDLETICMKSLRKEPTARYASALALANDLYRFIRGHPIQARPVGRLERGIKWARRRPGVAALSGVALFALLGLLGSGWWFSLELNRKVNETEASRRAAVEAGHQLETALTRQVADRIDNDLSLIAAVPATMATALGERDDWTEAQLEEWLALTLRQQPQIAGIGITFEPYQMEGQDSYNLYATRQPDGSMKKERLPLPPEMYREHDWYREVHERRKGFWTEPRFSPVAEELPIVTYGEPIIRNGKFVGVVAVDLSLAYFTNLRASLNQFPPRKDCHCYLLSRDGTFIYHPEAANTFPARQANLDGLAPHAGFRKLARRMRQEESGTDEAVDLTSGQPAEFHFARIRSAGWTFVLVVPVH